MYFQVKLNYMWLVTLTFLSLFFTTKNIPASEIKVGLTYSASPYVGYIADKNKLYFTGSGTYEIYDQATKRVIYTGQTIHQVNVKGTQIEILGLGTYTGPLIVYPYQYSNNLQVKVSIDNVKWRIYRGYFTVKSNGTYLQVVNVIEIEKYLYGVVPTEIGTSAPIEAAKAQSVAARTYAVSHSDLNARHFSEGYDVCDTQHCQAYGTGYSGGYQIERTGTNQAVDNTADILLLYTGNPISSIFYFSTCGGRTANSEDVWGGRVDYLKSISDNNGIGGTDFCSTSGQYTWIYNITSSALLSLLKSNSATKPTTSSSVLSNNGINITSKDISNRAVEMKIQYTNPTETVTIKGTEFRAAVGNSTIKSTWITSITETNGIYYFTGRGYGHGVGMCQDGALEMANQGYRYDQILTHYYTGVTVGDLTGPNIIHTAISTATYNVAINVTATVTDTSGVKSNSVTLYYRPSDGTSYTPVTMSYNYNNIFYTEIPNVAVTLTGIDYYFKALDNKDNISYLPVNYNINPYRIVVVTNTVVMDTSKPVIDNIPVTTGQVNIVIPVTVRVTDDGTVSSVLLYYRKLDSTDFVSQTMNFTNTYYNYTGDIPGDMVTTAGIEYYIAAIDSYGNYNETNKFIVNVPENNPPPVPEPQPTKNYVARKIFSPGTDAGEYTKFKLEFINNSATASIPKFIVFDLRGRVVKEITDSAMFAYTGQQGTVYWDGSDNFGKLVPPGIYLFQLVLGNHRYPGKLIVAR